MISTASQAWLLSRNISPVSGFLPEEEPLRHLPPAFAAWDELAARLPELVAARRLSTETPLTEAPGPGMLSSKAQRERFMLQLSCISHAWLVETGAQTLPAWLARPWVEVAEQLGRLPVLSHPSYALNNWHLREPGLPMLPENMIPAQQIHGGEDESWFILVTVSIEACGGPVIQAIMQGAEALVSGEPYRLARMLKRLTEQIGEMTLRLDRMREHCRPAFFYANIRPYLSSLQEIHYEGVSEESVRSYAGGSAAQSTLIQALDAFLGVKHPDARGGSFLREMRRYMPPAHAAFLHDLEQRDLSAAVAASAAVRDAFHETLDALTRFRTAHFRIASEYILGPAAREGKETAEGTGGTEVARFLKDVRNDTAQTKDSKPSEDKSV